MPPRHEDYCTLLRNPEDVPYLRTELLDVNMRLYVSSARYRSIVQDVADYLLWCASTEKEGYKKPHGFSGANAGIPWNIIATPSRVMLNPHILDAKGVKRSKSNCGSLLLAEPINIWRWEEITFEFWDMNGTRHQETGYFPTEQHEIDHNKGILITDRR